MTERKWTPGPWYGANMPGDWGLGGAWLICVDGKGPYEEDGQICTVDYITPYCLGSSKKERDEASQAAANARLIAAAPELYDALEKAAKCLNEAKQITGLGFPSAMIAIEKALAKARGE